VATVLDEFQRLEPEPVMVAQQSVPDPVPPVFETSQPELNRAPVLPPRPAPQGQLARSEAPPSSRPRPPSPPPVVPGPKQPDVQPGPAEPTAGLAQIGPPQAPRIEEAQEPVLLSWSDVAGATRGEQLKTVLAGVGVLCLIVYALRLLGEMDGSRKSPPKRKGRARAA